MTKNKKDSRSSKPNSRRYHRGLGNSNPVVRQITGGKMLDDETLAREIDLGGIPVDLIPGFDRTDSTPESEVITPAEKALGYIALIRAELYGIESPQVTAAHDDAKHDRPIDVSDPHLAKYADLEATLSAQQLLDDQSTGPIGD